MTTPVDYMVRHQVAAPPAAPRLYGLLSVAVEAEESGTVAEEGEGSGADAPAPWERGVEYYSPLCNMETGSLEGWCPTGDRVLSPFRPVRVEGAPVTVTSGSVCVAPTFDAEQAAREQLERGEEYRIEQEWWDRAIAQAPMVAPGPMPLDCAIGRLEGMATRVYGGQPVLHVPRQLLPQLFRHNLAQRTTDGAQLETPWGTPIAAGAGYALDTVDAEDTLVLLTGQVTVWRTSPIATGHFEARSNERIGEADRIYVVTADCLALSAAVPNCPGGGVL
ncbi:hypothetical protein [Streptomyces sp. NBRC 109706]|uniref:hypothetical protein n=1 Tax=Streptomyces sp. NBRC 109706 TaxID=1550035 RepID=UPI0007857DC8|nr:hypothetical protein [Streptomyces sp. NBRC 109706]